MTVAKEGWHRKITAVLTIMFLDASMILPVPVKAAGTDIVYVTQTGKRYHQASCSTIENSTHLKEMTVDEALDAGYTPCQVCKPDGTGSGNAGNTDASTSDSDKTNNNANDSNGSNTNISTAPVHFTDVPDDTWYYTQVYWAVDRGITGGTSATTFSPNKSCTRAEIVTFLWNENNRQEPANTDTGFSDVKSSDWFAKAVAWAVENSITSGTTATTFSPNRTCTRAEIVTFLSNYIRYQYGADKVTFDGTTPFTDVPTDSWYASRIAWAYGHDIASGKTETTFAPLDTCTRAEAMMMIYKAVTEDQDNPRYVDVTRYGVTPDDGNDDTSAIHAAVDNILNSSTRKTLYFPAGVYNCSAGLSLGGAVHVDDVAGTGRLNNIRIILAPGAVLQMLDSSDSDGNTLIYARKLSNLVICGGTLQGLRDMSVGSLEDAYGIELLGCSHVLISNINIHDLRGDGIYLGVDQNTNTGCSDITIRNVQSYNNTRHGLAIISANNLTVQNSAFNNNNGAVQSDGITVEANAGDPASGNITIEDCTMNNNAFLGFLTFSAVHDVTLRNCTINGNQGRLNSGENVNVMLYPNTVTNLTITNCTIAGKTVNTSVSNVPSNDWSKRW